MATARLQELQSRFEENPRRFFAPYANELRKAGDLTKAIEICRSHLAAQPGHVSGHIVLAQALYESDAVDEARAEFEASLELDPENLIALRFMGDIARARGERDAARLWYERVLDADPRNDEIADLLRDLSAPPNEPATTATTPESDRALTPVVSPAIDQSAPTPVVAHEAWSPETEILEPFRGANGSSRTSNAEASGEPSAPPPTGADQGQPPQAAHDPWAAALDEEEDDEPLTVEGFFDDAVAPTAAAVEPPASDSDWLAEEDATDSEEQPAMPATPPDSGWLAFDDSEEEAEAAAERDSDDDRDDEDEAWEASDADDPDDVEAYDGDRASADREDQRKPQPTPAAALSDFEAAPEDWLEEESESLFDTEENAIQSSASAEPRTSSTSQNDDIESWFDAPRSPTRPASPESEIAGSDMWAAPRLEFSAPTGESDAETAPDSVEQPVEADAQPSFFSAEQSPVSAEQPLDVEAVRAEQPGGHEDETGEVAENEPTAERRESDFDPMVGRTPAFTSAVSPAPNSPFVTETLAELYLQQGFRDEALAIYRQLSDRDPTDLTLRRRIAAIEQGSASDVLPDLPSMKRSPASALASISVRHFFGRLARRQATRRPSSDQRSGGGGSRGIPLGFKPGGAGFHSPSGSGEGPTPVDLASQTSSGFVAFSSSPSALAQLFSAGKPSSADTAAASTLATAFSEPVPGVAGSQPSRTAEQEMSLDHLFRESPNAPPSGMKLDDFFATPSQPGRAPSPAGEQGSGSQRPDERSTDIRQFSAWLEGLKKK